MCSDAFLYKGATPGMMYCRCPKCGEIVYVFPNDLSGKTEDGANEYFVKCEDCGNWFNASVDY